MNQIHPAWPANKCLRADAKAFIAARLRKCGRRGPSPKRARQLVARIERSGLVD